MENYRNRRMCWEQTKALEFCLDSLINSKGKHKKQFELMPEELKNQFLTLNKLLPSINASYEEFLFHQSCSNPKLANRFLPKELKGKFELIKSARENALA